MQNLDLAVDGLLAQQPWLLDLHRRRPRKDAQLCRWCLRERFERVAATEGAALAADKESRR